MPWSFRRRGEALEITPPINLDPPSIVTKFFIEKNADPHYLTIDLISAEAANNLKLALETAQLSQNFSIDQNKIRIENYSIQQVNCISAHIFNEPDFINQNIIEGFEVTTPERVRQTRNDPPPPPGRGGVARVLTFEDEEDVESLAEETPPDLGTPIIQNLETSYTAAITTEHEQELAAKLGDLGEISLSKIDEAGLCCPITQQPIKHPVKIVENNFIYYFEKQAIVDWININKENRNRPVIPSIN